MRKVVIGGNSAGKHDLSRNEGITSSAHHESGEERMMLLTSSVVVGEKAARMGGGVGGGICGDERETLKDERS